MRTTVKLENDVERLLQAAMKRSGQSLDATVNAAVREAFSHRPAGDFVVNAKPMRLKRGVAPTSMNQVADELEANETAMKTPRRRARSA